MGFTLLLLAALLAAPPTPAPKLMTPQAPAPTPKPAPTGRGKEALTLYKRLDDDRALVHILSGPADLRTVVKCPDLFNEIEVWTYLQHPALGKGAQVLFYPESGTGLYRYWTVAAGERSLVSPKVVKPLKEAGVEACSDGTQVLAALDAITRRQGSIDGGLKERAAMTAQDEKPTTAATSPPPLPVNLPALSAKERKSLLQTIPERYRRFVEDVEPIITDLERDTFLRIPSDYQRDQFIQEFWRRRSANLETLGGASSQEIYSARLETVRERFGNTRSDQGRIYLLHGPPDGVRKVSCEDIFWPLEIWFYERLDSMRLNKVLLVFYQQFGAGPFKLWTPLDGQQAILVGGMTGLGAPGPSRRVDVTRCPEWRDVLGALSQSAVLFGTATSMKMVQELREGPKPDVEGADRILQLTNEIAAGAAKLDVQRLLRFPEATATKVRMELGLLLDKGSLGLKTIGGESFFDVDVVGEVITKGRLIDNFRYRFDFPSDLVTGAFLPMSVDRELFPGEYRLRVKVADANRNAAGLIDEPITVPDVPDASLTPEDRKAREEARAAIARLVAAPNFGKGTVSLLPLAKEIVTGLTRFETRVSSADIVAMDFLLNGYKVMTKRRPPFEADLDLGPLPRRQVVKVAGRGRDGALLSEDEMVLNEGREAFRVQITAPDKGAHLAGPVRLKAEVVVPETRKLQAVDFYVNETKAATKGEGPFSEVVEIPRSDQIGFVRVVAVLEDGARTEDVRYYNAPKYLSEVNVRAVELYTSVLRDRKPVSGLKQANFTVVEDGVKQEVEGCEEVSNVPLSLGIAIDTSGSMEESLPEAQQAASGFLRAVTTPRDRTFLINFDNEPRLVSGFTTDRDRLVQGIATLRAQGSTTLWDAIVYGLFQFQGSRGRKAFVILSDGDDRSSNFDYPSALDYAKKSGIPIYFIGLRIGSSQFDIRGKLNKMSKETGGTTFYIDNARHLEGVYKEIEDELRSQYLLSYTPKLNAAARPDAWRKVEVKVTPSNLVARTISGYYP